MTPNPPPSAPLEDCATPGPRLIRRLTATQYRNSLVDLFQDPNVPEAETLTDPSILGFHIDADAPVVEALTAELLMNYAESVAVWAVQNKKGQIANCSNHASQCWRQVIQSFGTKVQREPLTDARIAEYEKLFAGEESFDAGLEVVLTALLQSPYLLYRRELGEEKNGVFQLTGYEIASQLSYLLQDTTPDAQLLEAAAAGRLSTEEGVDAAKNRLLSSPKAREPVKKFVEGWLELDDLPEKAKEPSVYDLTPAMREAMLGETAEFFLNAFSSQGTVDDLFKANYTFVNRDLAQFYGINGVNGTGFERRDLPAGTRPPGLIGHAAFLTAHAQPENSSPVQRGRVVRERLLCQDLPEVPADLDTNLAGAASFKNNRERYTEHSNNSACSGCHRVMDPVGFSLEHYDAFGRYRDSEGGMPIDATGMIYAAPDGTDVPLDGAESLTAYLVGNEAVRSCLVRYWSYFAHGRMDWEQRICNHDAVRREAAAGNYTLTSILSGIIHAPTFTTRVKDQ